MKRDIVVREFNRDDDGLPHSVDDKPAIISEGGTKIWYYHGALHRTTGPAVVYMGGKDAEWYLNSVQVNKQVNQFKQETGIDVDNASPEEIDYMWLYLGLRYDDNNKPIFQK